MVTMIVNIFMPVIYYTQYAFKYLFILHVIRSLIRHFFVYVASNLVLVFPETV